MGLVSTALDILQGEKNIGIGFLLPTITTLKIELKKLKTDNNIKNCASLVNGLNDVICNSFQFLFSQLNNHHCRCRFDHLFADNELRVAAFSDPRFKFDWIEKEDHLHAEKLMVEEYFRMKETESEVNGSPSLYTGK